MSIVVNLWSKKTGEIKRFLDSYYEKEINMDDDVDQWIYVYKNPLDAIDLISTVIDNNDKFEVTICIQIDKCDVHPVTAENHNDIIKSILYVYYKDEMAEVTY